MKSSGNLRLLSSPPIHLKLSRIVCPISQQKTLHCTITYQQWILSFYQVFWFLHLFVVLFIPAKGVVVKESVRKVRVISCYLVQVVEVLAWGTGTDIKYPVLMSTHSTIYNANTLHVQQLQIISVRFFIYFCLLNSSDVYATKKCLQKPLNQP